MAFAYLTSVVITTTHVVLYTRIMYVENRSRLKRILIDILGILIIVAAVPVGWIPGPGGIIVLIFGLSLLATNHEWAERILLSVKKHGINLGDKIFRDSKRAQLIIDVLGVAFVAAAVAVFMLVSNDLLLASGISLTIAGITLILGNRKRFSRMKSKVTKR